MGYTVYTVYYEEYMSEVICPVFVSLPVRKELSLLMFLGWEVRENVMLYMQYVHSLTCKHGP